MKVLVPLNVTEPSDREITVSRSFDAPRELVFAALTKPEMVKEWLYGPEEWPMVTCEINFKVGGKYRYVWRHKEKGDMGMGGVYREIVPSKRIVHTELFDQDWTGGETLVTTTFDETDGRTTVTSTVRYSSLEARDAALKTTGMIDGWGEAYDRLAEFLVANGGSMPVLEKVNLDLKQDPKVIVGSRLFDAPRDLVFEAWTKPEYLAEWWGPNGFTITTHDFDFKPGGVWRFVMHGPDGRDYQNRVTFDEIVPPKRIAYHHGGGDDVEPVQFRTIATFEDVGGKTKLNWRATFPSAEARERVIKEHGADKGLVQTLTRLGDYVENLGKRSS